MTQRIRALLVDDHPVVVWGLRAILDGDSRVEVVGEATNGPAALKNIKELQPDVVVIPIRLGGTRSGIELCRTIKSAAAARVMVFTSFTRDVDVHVAALAGADAVVSKSATPQGIIAALHRAADGGPAVHLAQDQTSGERSGQLTPGEPLTGREQEILGLVLEGLTNTAITERLVIGMSTVKTHMRSILRKLGVGTRRELL